MIVRTALAIGHAPAGDATVPGPLQFFFHHYAPLSTVPGSLMVLALLISAGLVVYCYATKRTQLAAVQKFTLVYAAMFLVIAALTYIPGLADDQGNFIGLFKLDLIDDLLHFGSALWALIAAWHSPKQAAIYCRLFGTIYALDGIIGLFTQRGILDFGLWLFERPDLSFAANLGANLPHIVIGSAALYAGFRLSKNATTTRPPR
ncbi:MAG TPA: DUF4383 domain-containing protein [Candidatus Andersenbacteria bacterium]|nr:DUF4383 domain-containing protein [Candidatus Andersenbacteria bacterium]